MADDISVRLGLDSDNAEQRMDRMLAKMAKAGDEAGKSGKFGASLSAGFAEAEGHLAGVLGATTAIGAAIAAATAGAKIFTQELERAKGLQKDAAAARESAADGARGEAVRTGRFSGQTDRIAIELARSNNVTVDEANRIIAGAGRVGGGMPDGQIMDFMRRAGKDVSMDAGFDPTSDVVSLIKMRKALGVGTADQTAGFARQFSRSAEQQAALTDAIEMGSSALQPGEQAPDPREAGAIFEYMMREGGNAGSASAMTSKFLFKGAFAGKIPSGATADATGKITPVMHDISATTPIGRLRELSMRWRQANEDQRPQILAALGLAKGGAGTDDLLQLLNDPSQIDALAQRATSAAMPGTPGAAAIAIGQDAALAGGPGEQRLMARRLRSQISISDVQNRPGALIDLARTGLQQLIRRSDAAPWERERYEQQVNETGLGWIDSALGKGYSDNAGRVGRKIISDLKTTGSISGANVDIANQILLILAKLEKSINESNQINRAQTRKPTRASSMNLEKQ